jgi:hypothetical protein
MKASIYGLLNPKDNSVFYIGVTIGKLNNRLSEHCSEKGYSVVSGKTADKEALIKELKKEGYRPSIFLIEEVDIFESERAERDAYLKYKRMGYVLIQSEKQFNCYKKHSAIRPHINTLHSSIPTRRTRFTQYMEHTLVSNSNKLLKKPVKP